MNNPFLCPSLVVGESQNNHWFRGQARETDFPSLFPVVSLRRVHTVLMPFQCFANATHRSNHFLPAQHLD